VAPDGDEISTTNRVDVFLWRQFFEQTGTSELCGLLMRPCAVSSTHGLASFSAQMNTVSQPPIHWKLPHARAGPPSPKPRKRRLTPRKRSATPAAKKRIHKSDQ
jgi:hypothetical protein